MGAAPSSSGTDEPGGSGADQLLAGSPSGQEQAPAPAMAPRLPSARIVYGTGPGSMPPMVEGGQVTRLRLYEVTAELPCAARGR
jgi:hypothetical protein